EDLQKYLGGEEEKEHGYSLCRAVQFQTCSTPIPESRISAKVILVGRAGAIIQPMFAQEGHKEAERRGTAKSDWFLVPIMLMLWAVAPKGRRPHMGELRFRLESRLRLNLRPIGSFGSCADQRRDPPIATSRSVQSAGSWGMHALTRRRDPDVSQESWRVYYDDIHPSRICIRANGHPAPCSDDANPHPQAINPSA